MFRNFKVVSRSQQRFNCEAHSAFIEKSNGIALILTMVKDYNHLIK